MGTNSTQGTLLKVNSTTIAQRVRIKPGENQRKEIETTDLDSTDDTYILGIRRGGTYELEINYDPASATHATLWSLYTGNTSASYKLVLADSGAAEIDFTGLLQSFQLGEMTTDNLQKATIKVRVTGSVSLTP